MCGTHPSSATLPCPSLSCPVLPCPSLPCLILPYVCLLALRHYTRQVLQVIVPHIHPMSPYILVFIVSISLKLSTPEIIYIPFYCLKNQYIRLYLRYLPSLFSESEKRQHIQSLKKIFVQLAYIHLPCSQSPPFSAYIKQFIRGRTCGKKGNVKPFQNLVFRICHTISESSGELIKRKK